MDIQEKIIGSHQNIKEKRYWMKEFSGDIVRSHFPYDFKTTNPYHPGKDSFHFSLPGDVFSQIEKIGGGTEVKMFIICVTGLILLLEKYTGNNDIIVGIPIYKQEKEGDFLNTVLPIRGRVGKVTFKDMLLQMGRKIFAANEHMNYSIDTLVYNIKLPFSQEGFPLFDVSILMKNLHREEYIEAINTNLIFSLQIREQALEAKIRYNPLRYRESTLRQVAEHWGRLLKQGLTDINRKVTEIDILSEDDKTYILFDLNQTDADFPGDTTIHELIEEQVEKTPDKVALVFEETCLTYNRLNRRTNQLAYFLRERGVGPDIIVGILVERSLEMVIGLLGILKAGGAYLPIAPELPDKRINRLLEDAGSPILLTQRQVIKNHSYTFLQGLHHAKIDIRGTELRKPVTDLDSLPLPDRSLVDYDNYFNHIGIQMVHNAVSLETSRGCPFNCAYCHRIMPRQYYCRSAENIFEEVRLYYDLGVKKFSFIDDIFNFNKKNSMEFFRLIVKNGLDVKLFFPNGLRGDILTREYIDLMVEAGVINFALALETASPRLQKLINKNLNIDRLHENLVYTCEKHPRLILDLFTMHGFPSESEEEAMMTLDFIKRIHWLHFPFVSILRIYPNTEMEKLALAHGISREDITLNESCADHEVVPTTLPFDEEFTLKYQSDLYHEYFLDRERLLHVLPIQMSVLTPGELLEKYNSYMPLRMKNIDQLLDFFKISRDQLPRPQIKALEEDKTPVTDFNGKLKNIFKKDPPVEGALNVLLLDLSVAFGGDGHQLDVMVDAPLGVIAVMTYLQKEFAGKINGKIAQAKMDFQDYGDLKEILDSFQPDIIGIRTLTFYKNFFHETVSKIRQWGFAVPVIAGGPYASSGYRYLLQDKHIDLAVCNEGEITFSQLIGEVIKNRGKLPGKEVLGKIPGLAFVPGEDNLTRGGFAREIVVLDEADEMLSKLPGENLEHFTTSGDLAYVIFTSGSTGVPKGVMLEHRSALNVLNWFSRTARLSPAANVLMTYDYTSDPSVEDIFATLLTGATLFVTDQYLVIDRERFRGFVEKNRIHILNFVPRIIHELLAKGPKLPGLDIVLSGGERLDDTLKDRLVEQGYVVYNDYGPTEASIDCLSAACSREEVNLGKPIDNMACYILDRHNNPQPAGVPGELCMSGVGIARGYLNQPGLNRETFIPNPFVPGERLYKTGDMALRLRDGNIRFLGRKDHQVKIRGYRLEIGEVEYEIQKLEKIKQTAVATNVDKNGDNYLVCYYVAEKGLTFSKLRSILRSNLPDYMCPAFLVPVAKIPLTAQGKTDFSALPDPLAFAVSQGAGTPRTKVEKMVADAWQEVLDIKTVGLHDNFFELGGHSLNIIQVNKKINQIFKSDIPLVSMFRYTTVSSLADYLSGVTKKHKGETEDQRREMMEDTLQIIAGVQS